MGGGLPDLLQYYIGGGLPNLLQYFIGGGLESLLQYYSFERKMEGYNCITQYMDGPLAHGILLRIDSTLTK